MANRYEVNKDTMIQIRKGMQSVEKRWSSLCWENIGAKNPELARIKSDLEHRGFSEWEGFSLFHPDKK